MMRAGGGVAGRGGGRGGRERTLQGNQIGKYSAKISHMSFH